MRNNQTHAAPVDGNAQIADEREAFEAWMRHQSADILNFEFHKWTDGSYNSSYVNSRWKAWQARAALAAVPQASTPPRLVTAKEDDWLRNAATQASTRVADGKLVEASTAPAPKRHSIFAALAALPSTPPAPAKLNISISKEWLEEKLAEGDDSNVSAGFTPRRPCDTSPGCNASNCWGCGEAAPAATVQPAEGWEMYAVKGMQALHDALDHAERKGFLPDAIAPAWYSFDCMAEGAAAPVATVQPSVGNIEVTETGAIEYGLTAGAYKLAPGIYLLYPRPVLQAAPEGERHAR